MPAAKIADQNSALRNLPSVDELLRTPKGHEIAASAGEAHAVELIRQTIAQIRQRLMTTKNASSKETLLSECEDQLGNTWLVEQLADTRRVINATGVVIHTNLGRAPLSEAARRAIADETARYCTLEYDLA